MTTTDLARPGPGDAAPDDPDVAAGTTSETKQTDETDGAGARRRFVLLLGVIALGGLAIRLIYVLGWKNPGPAYGDALYYHWGANYLADGEGYIHPFQLIRHDLRIPGADHPPGYLTVLGGFSLLGLRSFLSHQIVSCILGVLGVVGMGLAGRRVAGDRVGLITAVVVAISPNVWFHDALVMSETLVVATTAAVLLTAYRWWDRPGWRSAVLFGFAVGIAGLVRSEALLLGPAIGVPLVFWQRSVPDEVLSAARTRRTRVVQLAAAGGVILAVLAPWTIYNLTRFEHPVPLSAQFDHTLVAANCDDVYFGPNTGYWSRKCVEEVEPLTDPEADASEEAVVFRRIARDYIGDHPDRFVEVIGARIARTFGLYAPQNQIELDHVLDSKEEGLGQLGLLTWFAIAATGILGMIGMRRAGRPIFPLLAVVGATVLTVAVTYGATRFRFAAELALCIPAAVTVDAFISARASRHAKRTEEAEATAEPEAPAEPGAEPEPQPEQDAEPTATTDTDVPSGLGSTELKAGRFAGFDGLRAIAAFGVLLTHVALASGFVGRSGSGYYLSRADVGVALFFALSGFLLYRPFIRSRLSDKPGMGIKRYLRHRALRIFPAYWLALTVLAVVLDVRGRSDINNPWDFVVYYGLLQSYSKQTALGGLQQAWTLTNEVAFYILLPLWAAGAVWLVRRLKPRLALATELGALAVAAAAALGFRLWIHTSQVVDPTIGNFDPRLHWIVANFHMFVPGMALALLYEWSRRQDRPLRSLELLRRHPLVCWALAGVAFWAVSTQLGLENQVGADHASQDLGQQLLYAAIGALLLAPVALAGDNLPRSLRWLATPVMVTLGVFSYGIYLWHEGITDIYREITDTMPPPGIVGNSPFLPLLAATIIGTIAAAAVSYYLVERPALRLKDRTGFLLGGWRPLDLAAGALLTPPADRAEAVAARRRAEPGRFSPRRWPAWVLPVGVIGVVIALPFWGLWIAPGPPMEEGFMLVFPERVLHGDVPNKDFLHLYGPGSLWVLAGFFKVLGTQLWVERLVGLIQVLGLIVGTTVVGWRWGRWTATVAGAVTAIIIMPPIQFTALAWVGGVALALWAVIVAVRVFDAPADGTDKAASRRHRAPLLAGLLGGAALLFRPDLIVALGLPFAALWFWGFNRLERRRWLIGILAGVSPYLVHLLLAGPGNAIEGMVTDPIFKLRPGRALPFPPPTDSLASFLNRAFVWRAWPWPFPALPESQQVFVWVFVLFAVSAVLVAIGVMARRAGSPNGWRLLALGLLALGTLPQTIQRADTAHLAWVSCVPFGLLPSALAEWGRLKGFSNRRARAGLLALPLVLMFALIPHYTVRWYADYVGQTFGYRRDGTAITNRGRTFYYGRPDVTKAAQQMLDDVEEVTEPGQRLIVGTGDLRRTPYSEAYLYFLLPQLEPGTRYIEMDPGMANTEDSGLADELREADVVILSTVYDDWVEPNTSTDLGSDEPNEVLEEEYCLHDSYGVQPSFILDAPERAIYELYLKCDNDEQ